MPRLSLVDHGVIYRNPNPGYQYVFASHSHPVELTNLEVICAYQSGQAMYAADLVLALTRSMDGGATWTYQGLIHDGSGDDRHYSYHDPFPTLLRDGSLVVTAFRADRTDADKPLFNLATGGLVPIETVLFRSRDGGRSWTDPQTVAVTTGPVLTPSGPIVELANGDWFLAFDSWHAFDAPGPYRPRTVGWFSSDRGASWGRETEFADGAASGKGFWHGKIVPLNDGRLFSLFWSADMASMATLPLHRCFGTADGLNWTSPETTNLPGQTNWPVDYGDGLMAAIYTAREMEHPGFFVALSTDSGATWDLENQVRVWNATGRATLGVDAPDAYPRSHDTIAFGAPTAMRLNDGDLYVSFWCTEMSVTQIQWARLRVS